MHDPPPADDLDAIRREMEALTWYHTVDLGNGLVTPGFYDHRPFLPYYGLPPSLEGKRALDIGAASGFFSFELEARGAEVTATDLPSWMAHDFGPRYEPDMAPDEAEHYLHDPFRFAHARRGSRVQRHLSTIYDIKPEEVGMFDVVFCGSVLVHLTDPARALSHIRSVTREVAIIATNLHAMESTEPLALFIGHQRGDGWWIPNRAALEAMIQSAGFTGWEWFSEFRLDYRNGEPGPYHAVVRAWTTPERPALLASTPPLARAAIAMPPHQPVSAAVETPTPPPTAVEPAASDAAELARLRVLVAAYENGRFLRFMRWLHPHRQRLAARLKRDR